MRESWDRCDLGEVTLNSEKMARLIMRALDTIKSTKFEAGFQYLNVYLIFRKTHFAFVIKINKIL